MRKMFTRTGGAATILASGLVAMTLLPGAAFAANYVSNGPTTSSSCSNSGVSCQSSFTHKGMTDTELLDGNNIGSNTAVMESASKNPSASSYDNLITLWGKSQNVQSYLNLPNSNTGVLDVYFESADEGEYNTGAAPNNWVNGAYPTPGGSGSWMTDLIGFITTLPFATEYAPAGAAITLLLNDLGGDAGVSTYTGNNSGGLWGIEWGYVPMEYDQPSPQNYEDAVNYRGYNQEFHVTGVAGTGMVNIGHIQYQTDYNYTTNLNYEQVAFDNSGTMKITFNFG